MINTQLASQIVNALKNDSKLDSNKDNTNSKLSPKEALSQALKQNLGLSKDASNEELLQKFIQNEANTKLKELVNKLLDQINSQKSPESPTLKQGGTLNLAPNFANELKTLSIELAKNDSFTQVLEKLNQILKPASEFKNENLAPLLKNSGVFFEAKLKDALNEELLPKSFHTLLNAIKSLSSEKIGIQITNLATENLNPKESLKELSKLISENKNENKQILNQSSFKTLLTLGSKIENFKNYINKNPNLANEKIIPIATKILKELNLLKNDFFKALSKPENLALNDTKSLKQLAQGFEKLENTLKNILNLTQKDTNKNRSVLENKKDTTWANSKIQQAVNDKKNDIAYENSKISNKQELQNEKKDFKPQEHLPQDEKLEEKTKEKDDPKNEIKDKNDTKDKNEIEHKNEIKKDDIKNLPKDSQKDEIKDTQEQKNNDIDFQQDNKELQKENPKDEKQNVKNDMKEKNNEKENKTQNSHNIKENIKSDMRENVLKFDKTLNEIKNETNSQNNQNPTQTSQNILKNQEVIKQNTIKNLAFSTENLELEKVQDLSKDLSNLSRKINESLKQLEPQTQNAKINLAELKNLENKLVLSAKDLAQIKPKTEQDIAESLHHDIKSTLLQISNLAKNESNEVVYNQANRLLAQIEINQLMSLANDSINTYLPFSWDDLNDSKIIFRRGKKDKFFAQIKLEFVKLGNLEILISLNNEKYIDINIMAENVEFRKTIYENAHELKKNINKAGLLSVNFFVGDIIRSKFNAKNMKNYDLEMGVDKKI